MDGDVPGYVLHERLVEGAGTTVDRGEHIATSRPVAVKRVRAGADQDARRRFRRELAALRSVQHPNVLEVIDVVERDDEVALVQPLMAGTLADRLAEEGTLPAVAVAELGADLARGLAALHAAGVLHRDVKPSNVLIDHEGVPRLGDLGVALVRDEAPTSIVGTAEYLDPEVAAGGDAGPAADIYGLGVTLYEALAGVPPFAGSTVLATLRAADRGVHVPLCDAASAAPPTLRAAVERAMARDPERRWPSAASLAAALDEARLDALGTPGAVATVQGAGPPPARSLGASVGTGAAAGERSGGTRHFGVRPATRMASPPTDADPPAGSAQRRRLLALVAAVIALPVLVLVAAAIGGGSDPRPSPVVAAEAPTTPAPLPLCPGQVQPVVPAGATLLRGDFTGAGCDAFATWSSGVLELLGGPGEPAARFRVGEPTDLVVVGDWDCTGVDAVGVYRPQDGLVYLFDGFADGDGELTSRPGYSSGRPGGVPVATDVDGDGCDEVVIQPAP